MGKYKLVIKALENHLNGEIKDTYKYGYLIYLTGAFYMLSTILKYDDRINVNQMIEIFDYFDSIFEKYYK